MTTQAQVHILGAGLTGMSAGVHLKSGYQIHERLAHAGGHAITLEEDGFRFDRTGHLLHLRDAKIRGWVEELLQGEFVEIQRRSVVFSHGRYTRYPYQANTHGLPPEIAYECLKSYLDALDKQSSAPTPKNFEDFCLTYFGEGFSKHFMIPYNKKLWGVDPKEITAEWCSRFVPMPKRDDVIAGAVGLNDRELGYNSHFIYPKRGIGELTHAITQEVAEHILYNQNITGIDIKKKQLLTSSGTYDYSALISSIPLDVLLSLINELPSEVAQAKARLRCNALWYLDVALNVPCGKDLHWAYIPEEKYAPYRVGCYSNFSAQMAPTGKSNLYVELASRTEPNLAMLTPQIAALLIEMGIIHQAADIQFVKPRKIDHAYVVFDHHYYQALSTITPFLANHDIYSCGRYGGWNYSSMEDALIFGREAATWAQQKLGT